MRLTLAEVVSEEEFGLVLRSGSPAALTRPVAGAETVEADRPEELTARDYIMLTTGVRLRGNPELQRQLVVESEARGVAALGFEVGLVFRSTPRARAENPLRPALAQKTCKNYKGWRSVFAANNFQTVQSGRECPLVSHVSDVWFRVTDLEVASGQGCVITTTAGDDYLDFTSGIAVTSTGHCHPQVVAAIADQAAAPRRPARRHRAGQGSGVGVPDLGHRRAGRTHGPVAAGQPWRSTSERFRGSGLLSFSAGIVPVLRDDSCQEASSSKAP